MVQGIRSDFRARIAAAARRLIEGDIVDASAGRFSRTVIMAGGADDAELERCCFEAALAGGLGAVSLRSGRDAGATPRRANIAFVEDGEPVEVRDCVPWSDEAGAIVLVPWDAREDCHFAIGHSGLERRAGRPAAMLGRGMSLARTRLERTARALRREEIGPGIEVFTATDAA